MIIRGASEYRHKPKTHFKIPLNKPKNDIIKKIQFGTSTSM